MAKFIKTKPTRKKLLEIISELQWATGKAHGMHADDLDPMGFEEAQKLLEFSVQLCEETTAFDNPPKPLNLYKNGVIK